MEKHFSHFTEHKEASGVLFHKNVYLPESLKLKARDFIRKMDTTDVYLTRHATDVINNSKDGESRRFSVNDVWDAIDFGIDRVLEDKDVDIFEIGVDENLYNSKKVEKVCKVGFRCPLDVDRDICLLMGFNGTKFSVITGYINLRDDEHNEGFKTYRYVQPPKRK